MLLVYKSLEKYVEILSLRKPILFIYENDQSPSLYYLEKYKGFVKVRNNREDIKKGLLYLINTYNELDCGFNVDPYLWNNLAIKYMALFNQMQYTSDIKNPDSKDVNSLP